MEDVLGLQGGGLYVRRRRTGCRAGCWASAPSPLPESSPHPDARVVSCERTWLRIVPRHRYSRRLVLSVIFLHILNVIIKFGWWFKSMEIQALLKIKSYFDSLSFGGVVPNILANKTGVMHNQV